MTNQFPKAISNLTELFQELADKELLDDDHIARFNAAQKLLVEYYNYFEHPEIEYPWNTPEFIEKWKEWKQYKAGQHKDYYKPIGEKKALTRLKELSNDNVDTALELIDNAMGLTWKGIFLPKNTSNKKTQNKKYIEHESDFECK